MRTSGVARRFAALVVVAFGALAAGAGPAHAFSGDVFPGTPPGEIPTYTIPAASCDAIRTGVGDAAKLSDLIVACSRAGGGSSPCDLVSGSIDSVPVGQCLDSFPIPLTPIDPARGFLESAVNLKGTSAGSNARFTDRDRISVTFAGALGRVDVEPNPGASGPNQCNGISVAAANQATCDSVSGLLAAAGFDSPPTLSHLLLLDVQNAGKSGFLRVGVCPGFHWSCPTAEPLTGTNFQGQMTFSVVYGSICSTVNRKTICCATYPAPRTGVPIPPCPR
jgi:hypothetical protein